MDRLLLLAVPVGALRKKEGVFPVSLLVGKVVSIAHSLGFFFVTKYKPFTAFCCEGRCYMPKIKKCDVGQF